MYSLDCICRRRCSIRSGNHVAIEMIVDLMPKSMQKIMGNTDFHRGYGCNRISVHAEHQFHPGVREGGRSTSIVKIPYSWVYCIAIVSYFDMIIKLFSTPCSTA